MSDRVITKTDNRPPLIEPDQLKRDFAHLEAELQKLEAVEFPTVIEDDEDIETCTKLANDLIDFRKKTEVQRKEATRPLLDAGEIVNDYFKHGLQYRALVRQERIELIAKVYLKKKAERERVAREAAALKARLEAEEAQRKLAEAAAASQAAQQEAADQNATSVMPMLKAAETADALTAFANKASGAAVAPVSELSRSRTAAGMAGLKSVWTFEVTDWEALDLNALRPHLTRAAIEAAMRAFVKDGGREINGARIFEDADVNFRKGR
jgi:hypothetical protein